MNFPSNTFNENNMNVQSDINNQPIMNPDFMPQVIENQESEFNVEGEDAEL
eukprot:CAMPEP_0116878550 /NCGR_PEP_ID=MMETSP0463-20121206/10298_1 /TAXON_ID=181622 /ORGANISM="Strombidinopsis sp, Strain SopsisLIS2011" /LENGTH=50 /DNA_ID=CAMNT_0004526879 /DNA_START=852 /DNA_END=1004 /DNA_ORIENTATION=+